MWPLSAIVWFSQTTRRHPGYVEPASWFRLNTNTPTHTDLGFALEVEGEDVFSAPRLALADQKHAVARRAAGQHQLSSFEAGQRAVEPLALAERVFHRLCRRGLREQEGACVVGGA